MVFGGFASRQGNTHCSENIDNYFRDISLMPVWDIPRKTGAPQ